MEAASDHGFPVLPLLYFPEFTGNFDPESRLADHFSVILFRPACAPSPVLRFSFYCKLLQLSPGTFFQVACKTVASLTSGKILIPPIINHFFFHIRRKPASHVLRIPERSGSVHVSHFHWQAADESFFLLQKVVGKFLAVSIPLAFPSNSSQGTSCIFSI